MTRQQAREGAGSALPSYLRRHFPEYDFGELFWERDRALIVGRVLREGGWLAVGWLRSRMSDEEIAAWIENHAGRGISPERLRFWEAILPLPRGKVDRWIAASRAESWGRRLAR